MRKSTEGTTQQRRNLMFPETLAAELAEVRQKTGAQSDSEVLRHAFRLYKHLLEHHEGSVYVRDKEGKEQKLLAL
jgi:metal-responsive CopG/Arc/MetJ family transcriptional regulator